MTSCSVSQLKADKGEEDIHILAGRHHCVLARKSTEEASHFSFYLSPSVQLWLSCFIALEASMKG